ncbi:DUF433 domain-containing protein [Mesorhizobium sp. B2-4-13]|uniref:DUF433 domain-containing protein n=1 Tax=Mesorhizobium sp. B2-4-13 TaxID=2589936 RepID=UPI0011531A0A|nr:DUF433 domain-containing protein [Mesorhizobium sp. B2-4-13]TPK85685.1 DUF433 domain-containing protein [Mesorhizobium sp. B2-4-13]
MENLTVAQAAFVVGESVAAFRKTVEKAPVRPLSHGPGKRWAFKVHDLVFFHAYPELKRALTDAGRQDLYSALREIPAEREVRIVAFGKQKYDLSENYRAVVGQLKKLRALHAEIDDSGDEALIKGTSIEAHRVAALLAGGASLERILADYPSLDEDKVHAAELYAAAHPKVGRPYPKTTAKKALESVDFSALDDLA